MGWEGCAPPPKGEARERRPRPGEGAAHGLVRAWRPSEKVGRQKSGEKSSCGTMGGKDGASRAAPDGPAPPGRVVPRKEDINMSTAIRPHATFGTERRNTPGVLFRSQAMFNAISTNIAMFPSLPITMAAFMVTLGTTPGTWSQAVSILVH